MPTPILHACVRRLRHARPSCGSRAPRRCPLTSRSSRNDPKLSDVFEAFVVDFAHRWDEELPQPAERAVEHVLV
eukprot:5921908-Prymnesium_polylepis.1